MFVVAREEAIAGVEHFVMTFADREAYFQKADLALSLEKRGGEVDRKMSPAWIRYQWPLRAGTSWTQTLTFERPKRRSTEEVIYKCTVSDPQTIVVPAGEFRALNVECVNARSGALLVDSWYAPDVMWYVRNRVPTRGGFIEWQLIGHQRK
ncbi:MAG: hypothetical protein HYR86_15005 [Candidatus Rokubacteria bacterium]|nr:hypothetical protein [Candidatus Rokubacteria bacterium]